jgi:hypothetical protein
LDGRAALLRAPNPSQDRAATLPIRWPFANRGISRSSQEDAMTNQNEKPGQSKDQLEQQRQREQQQKQDQGGKKQGFDKDQKPQQGGQSDKGHRQA